MKFCVKSRQPLHILKKADEIRVEYRDREQIFDFLEKLENKTYLINIPTNTEMDKNLISAFHEKGDIILEFHHIDLYTIKWCKENGIKWCWAYPITTFCELKAILTLGPCYLLLGAPLCFSLNKVSNYGIPIRLIANQAGLDYIPTLNGCCGPWIRPEAIEKYEKYVSAIDFVSDNLTQEAALLKIYSEDKCFIDNLRFLFKNFNLDIYNYDIPDTIEEERMICGQKCMENRCTLCLSGIRFARSVEKLRNSIKPSENDNS